MKTLIRFFRKTEGYEMLVLRLWTGGAMMWYSHGYLFSEGGLAAFRDYAVSLEIPLAFYLAPVAKVFEFVGGAMILLGFYGRIGALLITPVMLVATGYAHDFKVFTDAGISFNLLLMNIAIVLGGTGKYSLKDFPA